MSGQWNFEVFANFAGEELEYFAVARDGTDFAGAAVNVDRVVAAFPEKLRSRVAPSAGSDRGASCRRQRERLANHFVAGHGFLG